MEVVYLLNIEKYIRLEGQNLGSLLILILVYYLHAGKNMFKCLENTFKK